MTIKDQPLRSQNSFGAVFLSEEKITGLVDNDVIDAKDIIFNAKH